MADDSHDSSGTPQPEGGEAKTFTQADIDRIITERLAKAENASKKTTEEAVAKALAEERESVRIANLQGAERQKAEYEAYRAKAEADSRKMADTLAQAQMDLARYKAESMLASMGLPTEVAVNLLGTDDEATKKNIDAFAQAFSKAVEAKVSESIAKGAPQTGGAPPEDAMLQTMRGIAGLR